MMFPISSCGVFHMLIILLGHMGFSIPKAQGCDRETEKARWHAGMREAAGKAFADDAVGVSPRNDYVFLQPCR